MMLLLLLVFLTLLASFCSCQFQELYLQCTGKLTGLQELGRAWSLIVGTENFAPIYDLTRDLNYSISEESLRGSADVTQNIAQLLCNAHGILHEMIAQFEPTEPVNEDLLEVFKEKIWSQWLETINRFNAAVCDLQLPEHLKEAGHVRIDMASMTPMKQGRHGRLEQLKGNRREENIIDIKLTQLQRAHKRLEKLCTKKSKQTFP